VRSSRIQLVVLAVNILFWGGIYGWTLTRSADDIKPPDRLDSTAFPAAAEPICDATLEDIEALGLPTSVDSPQERADLVDEENRLLRTMVDDLASLDRPSGQEGEWVGQWLDDWRTHIDDRQDWADDLRVGDDHAFRETDRYGGQISKVIDNFAEVNEMDSCATTGDV
jgi:hypothetical protein